MAEQRTRCNVCRQLVNSHDKMLKCYLCNEKNHIKCLYNFTNEEYEYSHIKLTVRSNAIDLARLKKRMLNL